MTDAQPIRRPLPTLTGGGGTIIEALLVLSAGVTATLAALAWRRPPVPSDNDGRPTTGTPASAEANEQSDSSDDAERAR